MAFFQDLGKKISNATQDAAKKTSELIEVGKLNAAINNEKTAISEIHRKIGAAFYNLCQAGTPVPEALAADMQNITERLQNIANLENKIAEIKAEEAKEAAPASAPDAYAPAPAAAPEAAPVPDLAADLAPDLAAENPAAPARFCTSCGAPLETGMLFCGKCGAKAG
jgi:hypothetical protein